jgi:hypothetical protein
MYQQTNSQFATTCYTTSLLVGLDVKTQQIADNISSMMMLDQQSFITAENNVIVVKMDRDNLPYFDHPIISNGKAFVDLRKAYNREGILRSVGTYNFLVKRAGLDLQWVLNKEPFEAFVDYSVNSFATWFSNGLSSVLHLDEQQNMRIRVMAAIYYLGLYHTQVDISDDNIIALILRKVPRILSVIPATFISDMISEYEDNMIDIYKPCEPYKTNTMLNKLMTACNEIANSKDAVNIHSIANTICRGAFVDTDPTALSMIAIEHPPTFISMMSAILAGGIQNRTKLGTIVDKQKKAYDIDNFNVAYKRICGL